MQWLRKFWSVTRFAGKDLSHYASRLMVDEIQKGVMAMGAISFLLFLAATLVYTFLAMPSSYLYTHTLLAFLSLHVALSARASKDIKALYLLAMTLLIVGSVAIVLLAHHTGTLSAGLFGVLVLLFMIVPMVPWGLREAGSVVSLIYVVFTLSTLSVSGRFDLETLWLLQFLMFSAAAISLSLVVRNVIIRRDDIQVRYDLEKAHNEKEILAMRDPLTGAWNRRFLDNRFASIASQYREEGKVLHFAILDVDYFKQLNDRFGHDFGDLVLERLVAVFKARLNQRGFIIRLGGDEFALLYSDDYEGDLIVDGIAQLQTDEKIRSTCPGVHVSSGIVSVMPEQRAFLEELYKQADKALYHAKRNREGHRSQETIIKPVDESVLP